MHSRVRPVTISQARRYRAPQQAGFNLIEAAIVLGIVGLIVGAIWAAAGSAYENMRLQNASKQLLALVQGVRGTYANQPSGTVDVTVDTLAGMGVIPSDMLVLTNGSASIVHQWSGSVDTADQSSDVGMPAFSLTYNNIKTDSCNNLATRVANSARGSGLLRIATGGGTYLDLVNDSGAAPASGGPACASPADDIVFIFNIRG
jgi:hypothetical protein